MNLIIYHANCLDGFAAATIIYTHLLQMGNADDTIKLHPGNYNDPAPEVTKDTKVFVVDFSYPMPVMAKLARDAHSLVWLDHHASAIKAFDEFEDANVLETADIELCRDNTKSGAMLAWEWGFDKFRVPRMVAAISDRDTWQFKLPDTRELAAYAFTIPHEYNEFREMLFAFDSATHTYAQIGTVLNRQHQQRCEQLILNATVDSRVAYLNCDHMFASECGNLLAKRDDVDYAACYIIVRDEVRFSLRSNNDKRDVSIVAKRHGGGGHRNAAGCTLKLGSFTLGETLHSLEN